MSGGKLILVCVGGFFVLCLLGRCNSQPPTPPSAYEEQQRVRGKRLEDEKQIEKTYQEMIESSKDREWQKQHRGY
jgi:hypothetical protein